MAIRLPDNSIQLSNGKIIYADTPILGEDIAELMGLLAPPQHFVAFTGRGASGGGSGGPAGGGSTQSVAGPRGFQGASGEAGADGAQGNQGPVAPGGAMIANGTYSGDDTNGRLIPTGLPSPIKMLEIHVIGPSSAQPAPMTLFKPATVAGTDVGYLRFGASYTEEGLVTLVGNDFEVNNGGGSPVTANALGSTYHWVAWA